MEKKYYPPLSPLPLSKKIEIPPKILCPNPQQSFSLFQLFISVIYQQSNDLHLWPVTCEVYSVVARFHVSP